MTVYYSFGSTNAVQNTINADSSGDLVYTINDTETNLNNGDKVWLNVITNENSYIQRVNKSRYADQSWLPYSLGNQIFCGPNKYIWTGNNFETRSFLSFTPTISLIPIIRKWGMFFKNNKNVVFKNGQTITTPTGIILNDKYTIQSAGICTYNHLTGEETVIATIPQTTYSTVYMDDDSNAIMFYNQNTKTFDIYNNFNNPTEGHKTFTVSNNAYPMWVTNGLNNNSYFICNSNNTISLSGVKNLIIYKLYNDTLTIADDLPLSLQYYINRDDTQAMYRDDTKVLTIVNKNTNRIHVWKVINNKFQDLFNIPFNTVNGSLSNYLKLAMFNEDMTQLVIFYMYGGSTIYYTNDVLHYNILDGKFHATTNFYNNETTLTGFATGEINENNEVEIKTTLPPEVTMIFNITPDEDMFTYKGLTV